jgi:intracellular multiplication protein IcmK
MCRRPTTALAVVAALSCAISGLAVAGVVVPPATLNPELKAVPAPSQALQAATGAAPSPSVAGTTPATGSPQRSLDGGTGLYYLPPLPGRPSYVRPGVDTEYQQTSPLSVKEIEWLKKRMAASQYAMHKGSPLTIRNPILHVAMGPGSTVPVVHVARGYVTTLSIVDSEGNPWPITSYVIGGGAEAGATIFNVQSPVNIGGTRAAAPAATTATKSAKPVPASLPDNMLTLSPAYYGASSNMVVTLLGKSTPIMVDIISNSPTDKKVYGMVTLRVNRLGPDARPAIMQAPPPSPVQSDLMLFMEQTAPKGSEPLKASGGYGVKAWNWNGQTVVRSRTPLAMPAWTAEIQQNGVRVYQVPMTTQLLLRTDTGMKNVSLRRAEDSLENPDANYLIGTPITKSLPKAVAAPPTKIAPPIVQLIGGAAHG